MKVAIIKKSYSKKNFSGPLEAPGCLPDGPVLQELLRGRTQKRLGRIFSFRIFLNLLNPLELPIPLVALLELEKLTAIQLGCDALLGKIQNLPCLTQKTILRMAFF